VARSSRDMIPTIRHKVRLSLQCVVVMMVAIGSANGLSEAGQTHLAAQCDYSGVSCLSEG
jgi:hypothetical protein